MATDVSELLEGHGGGNNPKEWTCGLCGGTMRGCDRPHHLTDHD